MYKKILLKLSGEVLAGNKGYGITPAPLAHYTTEIIQAHKAGVAIAIVVGGGNICRGVQAKTLGIERVAADYMGMLATIINGIALQDSLLKRGIEARLMTRISMMTICEAYNRNKALQYLEKRKVVIIAGGLGKPYFTTDSTASLSGIELGVDVLLKGTNVDGIYSVDPKKEPNAILYKDISIKEVLTKKLRVMDMTALTLCAEEHLPIIVYNATKPGKLMQVIQKKQAGTLIHV